MTRPMRMRGEAQKMTSPLVLHGEGDEQIPPSISEKGFAAVRSKKKILDVFTRAEGGFHHCRVDNITLSTQYMRYAALVLRSAQAGQMICNEYDSHIAQR